MPVKALRFIRKVRGGAQAHLLEAQDGHFYIVKFRNNPQHRRILINEWIASVVLRYLRISTPATAMIEITPEFIEANPEVHFQFGSRKAPIDPGFHFGSQYPGDPSRLAVYDFLPDALLERVANLNEFLAVYVADKWLGNADARQSIFFRARLREAGSGAGLSLVGAAVKERAGFMAQMMDHGYIFDGPHWAFHDSPLQGLYFRPVVYSSVRSLQDFQPWLDRIAFFPEEVIDDAFRQIPGAWMNGDIDALEALLEKLLSRRKKVPEMIESSRQARGGVFPNWV
jgi:hypothetical protein